MSGLRQRKTRLIGMKINCSHPQQTTSTLRSADINGIADTQVCKPASVTNVHAPLPGDVELTCGG